MNSISLGEREAAVITALKTVLHTIDLDPEFFRHCVGIAGKFSTPSFGYLLEQHEGEFQGLLSHVKGCRSALEIGSRYGKSIQRIAMEMGPGTKVVAIDLPQTAGCVGQPDPEPILRETMRQIGDLGHEAHLFLGNSRAPTLIEAVRKLGPFDFCFIDGDHSAEGVRADWANYGPMARIVAFHDIINNKGCFDLWKEIKASHRTVEYTASTWLGIGVVFKDN